MRKVSVLLLLFSLMLFISAFEVRDQEKTVKKTTFKYGGVATCKPCHLTSKSGAQYKIWAKGPHAKAYETLATPKAKEWAKEADIEDPQKSEKCVKCHVTAYGVDAKLKGPKLKMAEGVSCEACHGPGSEYKKRKVMLDIYAGKVGGAKYGLVKPIKEVCVGCHNEESPAYQDFKFEELVAKIAHPIPKK